MRLCIYFLERGDWLLCLAGRTTVRSGIREAVLCWKPWQPCAVLLSSPGPAWEEKRGETDTCRSLIPFNTCIQRSPRFRRDMKTHGGLTRYIFDGLPFSCNACISHSAHTRNDKQYRLPSCDCAGKHLRKEIWISLPSLYFFQSSDDTCRMIDGGPSGP